MLFLLTGDVQIGKTRWLERLAAELAGDGVPVAGVLAPGVWRVREPHEVPGERGLAGEGRFEKLGIDNVLLPGGERVPFARRRDLALAEGSFDPTSQSASAQLAWESSAMPPAMRRAWAEDGYRVRVVVPSREQWETTTRPVSVTDAGFTELDGPTETTRAFW